MRYIKKLFNIYYPTLIILLFLILFLSSCQKNRIYEKRIDLDNNVWYRVDKNHIIKFQVAVKDTTPLYDIIVSVRYMDGFPFTDLYFGMTIYTPNNEEKSDDYRMILRGPDGSYKGEGLGDLWDLDTPIIKGYHFNKPGNYRFEIINLMSKYDTPGIMQIGLIIDKEKSEHQ